MADGNLVGNYGTVLVALSFDLEYGKVAVLQFRQRTLQCAMKFVLQLRHLLGRRQDACVYLVDAFVSGAGDHCDLLGLGRDGRLGLVAQPTTGHEENEDEYTDNGEIVLP